MKVIHNLKPIYDANSKVLILGTFPSVISRNENFYYANPQNRFWKIMEILFNQKFSNNEEKTYFLLQNNIAIWDTLASCDITGSSDTSIKNIKVNDINKLIKKTNIKYIFCTGQKAYQTFIKYIKTDLCVFPLPSPSSANATYSLEKLVHEYTKIKDVLQK